jgi:hypothetical protein
MDVPRLGWGLDDELRRLTLVAGALAVNLHALRLVRRSRSRRRPVDSIHGSDRSSASSAWCVPGYPDPFIRACAAVAALAPALLRVADVVREGLARTYVTTGGGDVTAGLSKTLSAAAPGDTLAGFLFFGGILSGIVAALVGLAVELPLVQFRRARERRDQQPSDESATPAAPRLFRTPVDSPIAAWCRRSRTSTLPAVVVFVAVLGAMLASYNFYDWLLNHQRFDSYLWRGAPVRHASWGWTTGSPDRTRFLMEGDLMERLLRRGMDRVAVRGLLGPPENDREWALGRAWAERSDVYALGEPADTWDAWGFLNYFGWQAPEALELVYDGSGKLADVRRHEAISED